jgi:large subunit ribosomal protein L29
MTLPKYKDLNNLVNISDIDKEIFLLQKNLFDLRIKKATNQSIKVHLFKHAKRRIAQLKFKKGILLNRYGNICRLREKMMHQAFRECR